MPLPVKLQASILSWVGETPPTAAARAAVATTTKSPVRHEEEQGGKLEEEVCSCLSAADVFLLSDAAAAAGSPCVVVKDGFLGQEETSRVYQGEYKQEAASIYNTVDCGRALTTRVRCMYDGG